MTDTVQARSARIKDLVTQHGLWSNPRTHTGLSDKEISALAADIKERGVLDPLKVLKVRDQDAIINLVIHGQRRRLAAEMALGETAEIPVLDLTEEPVELTSELVNRYLLDALAHDSKREGLSSYELSNVATKLRSQGVNLVEVGKAIGKHESWVSKILKARDHASEELLKSWQKGQITDEAFKELAQVKAEEQTAALDETLEARKVGDKAGARAAAKEKAQKAKAERPKKAKKVRNGVNKVEDATKETKKEPAKPRSRAVLDDMIETFTKRPPVHDYIKGIRDGVLYAVGEIEADAFGKAWVSYLNRIGSAGAKLPRQAKSTKANKRAKK